MDGFVRRDMSQASEDFSVATSAPICHRCACTYSRPATPQHLQASRWATGLCELASDLNACVWTCFCPCTTFGRNVEALDRGKSTSCLQAGCVWSVFCLAGMACLCSAQRRKLLRREFGIPAGECGDYCLHFWCGPCALCQEYRELKHRGFIPVTTSTANTLPPQNATMERN